MGGVNPLYQTTTVKVQYDLQSSPWCVGHGTSGAPAWTTAPQTLAATDNTFHEVSVDLTGLTGGGTYCLRMIAANASGTVNGSLVDGFTSGLPQVGGDVSAIPTGASTVTLDGWVNPVGQTTAYHAEYDLMSSTWCTSSLTSGTPAGTPASTTSPQTLADTDNTVHEVSVD